MATTQKDWEPSDSPPTQKSTFPKDLLDKLILGGYIHDCGCMICLLWHRQTSLFAYKFTQLPTRNQTFKHGMAKIRHLFSQFSHLYRCPSMGSFPLPCVWLSRGLQHCSFRSWSIISQLRSSKYRRSSPFKQLGENGWNLDFHPVTNHSSMILYHHFCLFCFIPARWNADLFVEATMVAGKIKSVAGQIQLL